MKRTIVICDICGGENAVQTLKLPVYRKFDATDGKTYYESPTLAYETLDICFDCLVKSTNIFDKRVQGYGDIVIAKNPVLEKETK